MAEENITNIVDAVPAANESEPTFTKRQLAASRRYQYKADIVNAVLEDGKTYTMAEVDSKIKYFMNKEVR